MVDRAANKRTFLFAKQAEEGSMGAQLQVGPDGKMALVNKDGTGDSTTPPPAAPPASPATPPVGDAAVAKLDLPKTLKGALEPITQRLVEQALHLHNAVASAAEAADGAELPADFRDAVKSVTGAVAELDKAINPPAATGTEPASRVAGDPQVEGATKGATPGGPIDKAGGAPTHEAIFAEQVAAIEKILSDIKGNVATMKPEDLRTRMGQIRDIMYRMDDASVVVNVGKSADLTDADLAAMADGNLPDRLAKIGRKMSAKNRSVFESALKVVRAEFDKLMGLYESLLPAEAREGAVAMRKRIVEEMGLPEADPENAGCGRWPSTPATGDMADTTAPGPGHDAVAALEKRATDTEAELAAMRVELAKAKAAVAPASSVAPEGVTKRGDEGDAGWPMDLNAKTYREQVARTGRY